MLTLLYIYVGLCTPIIAKKLKFEMETYMHWVVGFIAWPVLLLMVLLSCFEKEEHL